MPPRSPAPSARGDGTSAQSFTTADRNEHLPHNPRGLPAAAAAAASISPVFHTRASLRGSLVDRGVIGEGVERGTLPLLFSTDVDAAAADSDTSETSSTASSGEAIAALGAREEADSRDELIGILVPALKPEAEGPRGGGGGALPSELRFGDQEVNDEVRPNLSRSRSCSSSSVSASKCGGSLRVGHFRALSSTCLEGLGSAKAPDRRERSGSLFDALRRQREYSADSVDYTADLIDCSGAPSDREQSRTLLKQYSNEASAPPPQVLQGWNRNRVALDKRSWLEVRDKKHRYGKNLRLYFKEWDRRGKPGGSFFAWLSAPEVQLEGCPRIMLESDVVHYCRPEERESYALRLVVTEQGRAILRTAEGELVDCVRSPWLFVLRDGTIFATDKKTDPPRFHHSSFFGGGYVDAVGMLVAEDGVLKALYPHSGHYRPTNQHLQGLLKFLRGLGVDLNGLQVDAQRVHKVARPDKRTSFPRVRKMDNPFMVSALHLLDFFEAKHSAWSSAHFDLLYQKVKERRDRLHQQSPRAFTSKHPVGGNSGKGVFGGSFTSDNSDRDSFSWVAYGGAGAAGGLGSNIGSFSLDDGAEVLEDGDDGSGGDGCSAAGGSSGGGGGGGGGGSAGGGGGSAPLTPPAVGGEGGSALRKSLKRAVKTTTGWTAV